MGHSPVRKKVWPPPGQCSCLFHWSPMVLLPSQGQSWKNSRIQGYHVSDTIWSASCSLATYHKDIWDRYYPRFCGCGNQSSGKICPTSQKGGKKRTGFVEAPRGCPLGNPLGPRISSINRLLWDRTPSPHPLSPRSKEIVESHIGQVLIPTLLAMWCFNLPSWVILTRSLRTTDHFLQFVDEYLCLVEFQNLLAFPS